MKTLIISLLSLFCVNAFAQSESFREFNVEHAEFSPTHIQSPTSAVLAVDYQKSEISLHVTRAMPPCPAGRMCVQVMPEPFEITLPIQSIQKDDCGVFHVVAEKDFRPVDGFLHRIEMADATETVCSPLEQQAATYQTRAWNRVGGGEVSAVSSMLIRPRMNASNLEILTLVRGQFVKGFPEYQTPGPGKLVLQKNKVQLKVDVHMNCANRICPRIMPQPLMVDAPIIKVEEIECGQMTTAIKDLRKQSGSYVEIKVKDYSQSTCRFLVKPTTDVEYRASYTRGDKTYNYEANFSFDRK